MIKTLNELGYQNIASFEGCKLKPYYATIEEKNKNIVTIGYGNTTYIDGTPVKITDNIISKEEAYELLKLTADNFTKKLIKVIKSEINQNQLNALCSIAYNIGINAFTKSTVLKLVNINPNDHNIEKAFLMWNKQAGIELPGLTKRRQKEWLIYSKK